MDNKPKWYILTQKKRTEDSDAGKDTLAVYTISLTIPKIKLLLESATMRRTNSIPCTKYTVFPVPDTPFQVKMCFLGTNIELFEIYVLSTTSVPMTVELTTAGIITFEPVTKKYIMTVQENEWRFLTSLKFNSYARHNDILCLNFEFYVSQDNKKENIDSLLSQLSNDYGILFSDGIYFDATIKSANGVEFRVHKNVLAVRSKVLRAHFNHQTIETITNVVETTWETEVLRDLLTFVYTGKAPHVHDAPDKLLAAADYYQLNGLKDLSEKALKARLTVENAIETLQLAELHSVYTLREFTLTFINDGNARLITETEGWENAKIEIVKMVYNFITAHEKENYNILAAASANVE